MSHIRKRAGVTYYKDVQAYVADWRLMFDNARTYNQEGSWVYNDAEQMHKVLEATFRQLTFNSGLPGAEGNAPPPPMYGGHGSGGEASRSRRVIESDDEYASAGDTDD